VPKRTAGTANARDQGHAHTVFKMPPMSHLQTLTDLSPFEATIHVDTVVSIDR